jgi:hypothetical protein
MTEPRWVIHLPTTLTTHDEAVELTAALRDSLSHITVLDFGEATLTEEDNQRVHHRVYCDKLHRDGNRCRLRDRHDNSCTASSPDPDL